jgi:U3 small nucleolar RNA-associated protein 3
LIKLISSASFEDEEADGPRALTRAIEKNRGLTPRRNKTGRNPRVKKRLAYEKAKQKVGSQRAVYKGGQATVGGNYAGEKTGISTVVKSRKF